MCWAWCKLPWTPTLDAADAPHRDRLDTANDEHYRAAFEAAEAKRRFFTLAHVLREALLLKLEQHYGYPLERDWEMSVLHGKVDFPALSSNSRVLGHTEPAVISKYMIFRTLLTEMTVLMSGPTSTPSRTKRGSTRRKSWYASWKK